MRSPRLLILPLLLIALASIASASFAQTSPGATTGGVVITRSPEDGAPVPASFGRTLMRLDLPAARQWFAGFAAPVLPASARASLKPRRAGLLRNPVRVP